MSAVSVAIVGGGAAGLAAAIAAAREGAHVMVLEAGQRVGKTILATGNGRCNLTNLKAGPEDYNNPAFVTPVLGVWTPERVLEFFESIGLLAVEESQGRMYPLSNSATNVLNVLRAACSLLGVEMLCEKEVAGIRHAGAIYEIVCTDGSMFEAKHVVVTTGGATELLACTGHSIARFTPALCGITTDARNLKELAGVRAHASVRAYHEDDPEVPYFEQEGEVQFRDYGLSGIVIFDLSRHVDEGDTISVDLLPGQPEEEFASWLRHRHAVLSEHVGDGQMSEITYETLLCGCFQSSLNRAIVRAAGLKPSMQADPAQFMGISKTAHAFSLTVTGLHQANAQITRGGACVDEFDAQTLESKLASGLFAAGETLDIDGPCGGFNLQWAWASGLTAGAAAAQDA